MSSRALTPQLLESLSLRRREVAHREPAVHQRQRVHNAIAVLAQLCSEMGTLIDANPGHINATRLGIGDANYVRTWP